MSASPAILWFRRDLRLDANPALAAAVARGPVIPLFILDPADMPGAASRWWLHGSLEALAETLARLGAPLILRRGTPSEILPALAAETGARAIFWNRLYEPQLIARDKALKSALTAQGIEVESFNGSLLAEPWQVKAQSGDPYKVFTPFWRTLAQIPFPAPLPAPKKLAGIPSLPSDDLASWSLRPSKPDWAGGLRASWQPGERAAQSRLAAFIDGAMTAYREARDIPATEGTSRLSPHLHWGEISPHRIWSAVEAATAAHPSAAEAGRAFLRELAWRDFAHHLLFHWPSIATENWKSQFDAFPWKDDTAAFTAWTGGETGYPIVDAGMRQLWHARARALAAFAKIREAD